MSEATPGQLTMFPDVMGYTKYRPQPRFVAFGDVHLGTYKYPIRKYILNALDQVLSHVEKTQPDFVLFAGDAFRVRVPAAADVSEFGWFIKRMSNVAPVIMIPGNHDIAGRGATTLDVYNHMDNVRVVTFPSTIWVEDRAQIACVPWLPSKAMVSMSEDHGHLSNQALIEFLVQGMREKLNPEIPAILLAHCTAFGAEISDGVSTIYTNDVLWPSELFDGFGISILGHLHRPHLVPGTVSTWYVGSPSPTSFNEAGQEKSFIYYDQNMSTVEYDNYPQFVQTTPEDLPSIEPSERLFLQIITEEAIQDMDVPDCAWYEVITRPPQREMRARLDATKARNMTPKEAIVEWLDAEEHSGEMESVISLLERLTE